jgi:hypothetical protein
VPASASAGARDEAEDASTVVSFGLGVPPPRRAGGRHDTCFRFPHPTFIGAWGVTVKPSLCQQPGLELEKSSSEP